MALTRQQILDARHREGRGPRAVEVPEWGGEVFLRVLTVQDQMGLAEDVPAIEMPVQVLLACICDENGDRILEPSDAEALAKEDFPVILRLFSEAADLNGLSSKELEEAVATFAAARDERLSSSSPSLSGDPSASSTSPAAN